MLLQSNILKNRIQIVKTKITSTNKKSLVLIRATIQGEILRWGHVGRRLRVSSLTGTTKAEVYNSIRHSKVTADTGKVAAPLDEEAEASSLGLAKVSACAEGAASEVVGQTSEVKSEDQPQGSHEESQDQVSQDKS